MEKILTFIKTVLLQTWMIALYFVVDSVEVTYQADINRKDLTLDLSIFCFQFVLTFWTFVLFVALLSIVNTRRRGRRICVKLLVTTCIMGIIAMASYFYYSNLVLLLRVRDLNLDLKAEERDAPTQSGFILLSYYALVYCAYLVWVLMNFVLGMFIGAMVAELMAFWRRTVHQAANRESRRNFL